MFILWGFHMVRCIQGAKMHPILKCCLTNTGVQTDRNGNIVPVKINCQSNVLTGMAALLDCYVGLYKHYTEYTMAI